MVTTAIPNLYFVWRCAAISCNKYNRAIESGPPEQATRIRLFSGNRLCDFEGVINGSNKFFHIHEPSPPYHLGHSQIHEEPHKASIKDVKISAPATMISARPAGKPFTL